jgi:hypothetical protein
MLTIVQLHKAPEWERLEVGEMKFSMMMTHTVFFFAVKPNVLGCDMQCIAESACVPVWLTPVAAQTDYF